MNPVVLGGHKACQAGARWHRCPACRPGGGRGFIWVSPFRPFYFEKAGTGDPHALNGFFYFCDCLCCHQRILAFSTLFTLLTAWMETKTLHPGPRQLEIRAPEPLNGADNNLPKWCGVSASQWRLSSVTGGAHWLEDGILEIYGNYSHFQKQQQQQKINLPLIPKHQLRRTDPPTNTQEVFAVVYLFCIKCILL